tara:strand:- start:748 stop:1944 length:1197 start_codon:yes stop_codon:yes gene_type:complete
MKQKGISWFMILAIIGITFSGCTQTFASNQPPEITLKVSPTGVIKAEEEITFDASATIDRDGDILVYMWDFDDSNGIQREKSGSEVTWEYSVEGTYVVTLTVEDGQYSQTVTEEIEVIAKDSIRPEADAGSRMGIDDCDGEETSDSSKEFYLYFICETGSDSKEISDREVDATIDVVLDGSASTQEDPNHYLSKYEWDLDVNFDKDGDGDPSNDIDDTGETITWNDVPPGKWEVQLTVTDDQGLTDSDEITVYVNYVGEWNDFTVDRNASSSDNVREFEFNTVYEESPSVNRLKRAEFQLTYAKEDGDWAFSYEQRLDIYVYNKTKEWNINTSSTANDQRTGHNNFECNENDDYCVYTQVSGSYHVQKYYPGSWTAEIVNEEQNEANVKTFRIILMFK